jgi:hypothetical protein
MAFLGKIAKKGIMVGVVTKGPKIFRKKTVSRIGSQNEIPL